MARLEDAVGTRISSWAATRFRDELEVALELFAATDVDDGRRLIDGVAALELIRFVPPRRCAAPTVFTVEGDPIVDGQARWALREVAVALERLDSPPHLALVGARRGMLARPLSGRSSVRGRLRAAGRFPGAQCAWRAA